MSKYYYSFSAAYFSSDTFRVIYFEAILIDKFAFSLSVSSCFVAPFLFIKYPLFTHGISPEIPTISAFLLSTFRLSIFLYL